MASPEHALSTPLLPKSTPTSDSRSSPLTAKRPQHVLRCLSTATPPSTAASCSSNSLVKPLAVLSDHAGSVSCLALCGEFVLSASHGRDIIVWQQPDLRRFAKFGRGEGSVKALVAAGNRVFSAHQDGRIRVWKVSRSSENAFRLVATLPTAKDYFSNFLYKENYVQTRRHHKRLWIEHADSISCLAACGGVVYSGSWDRTLKVWRMSDLKCLESVRAHEDAINSLVAHRSLLYSASADGKIKVWGRGGGVAKNLSYCVLKGVMDSGRQDVSLNALVVCEDGRLVYGGGSDGRIMGWEGGGGHGEWKVVCNVRAHERSVLCLCAAGEFVCSGSADKSIGVWRRGGDGEMCSVGVVRGHEGPVKCLQASWDSLGNGFMLYSGGLDKSLRVWWVPKDFKCRDVDRDFGRV